MLNDDFSDNIETDIVEFDYDDLEESFQEMLQAFDKVDFSDISDYQSVSSHIADINIFVNLGLNPDAGLSKEEVEALEVFNTQMIEVEELVSSLFSLAQEPGRRKFNNAKKKLDELLEQLSYYPENE